MLAWEMTTLADAIIFPEIDLDACEEETLSKHLAALPLWE